MKRSKSLSLLVMGSMLASAQGCSRESARVDEEVFSAFSSLSECTNSGLFTDTECKELATMALAQTPRFTTQAECEASFGPEMCRNTGQAPAQVSATDPSAGAVASGTEVQPQGSSWMPMMMGFMAGRMLGGGMFMHGGQPLYRDPAATPGNQSFRTAGGETVRPDAKGRISNPSQGMKQSLGHMAKPAQGRVAPGARGGFGGGAKSGGMGS